jgi:hypothetical protein
MEVERAPQGSGQPQQSFADRARERLQAERAHEAPRQRPEAGRGEEGERNTGPDTGIPASLESAVDNDGYPTDDGAIADGEQDDDPEDHTLAPEGYEDDDPDDEPAVDWEKRYKDTQRMLSEVTERRREREAEQAEIVESALAMRHQLEDTLQEAQQFAQVYMHGFDSQIANLERAFSSGMIEPDKLPQARQQHQMLVQQREQLRHQVEQMQSMESEAKKRARQREAEISRAKLSRAIPNWNQETYRKIGAYAQERGYTSSEFAQITDHRVIELLHDSMQLRSAGRAVDKVRTRTKSRAPNRTAREQPRSADGRYKQAQQEFHERPNERGAFAKMKLADLQRQRRSPR